MHLFLLPYPLSYAPRAMCWGPCLTEGVPPSFLFATKKVKIQRLPHVQASTLIIDDIKHCDHRVGASAAGRGGARWPHDT